MEKTYLKKFISYAAAAAIAVSALSVASPAHATTTLDATDVTLDFIGDSEIFLDPTETHLYEDVATIDGVTIDALLTLVSVQGETSVDIVDAGNSSIDTYLYVDCDCDTEEDYTPADDYKGSVSYEIDFFEAGTDNPVTLENLSFYVRDIDTYQFIEVLNPKSYTFDANTELTAVTSSDNPEVEADHIRFQELDGMDADSDQQPFWVEVTFESTSNLTFKIGQDVPGGAFFSINFAPIAFDNPEEHGEGVTPPVLSKLTKTVFFTGDSAYLQPKWFKSLDKLIAKVPSCATNVTAKVYSGVKKAKSEVKGNKLAQRRAAILQKFLNKRGLDTTITLVPNGKGTKALDKKRFAKVVIKYVGCN